MAPKLEQSLKVWQMIVGLVVMAVGGFFTVGMAWESLNEQVKEIGKSQDIITAKRDSTLKEWSEWREKINHTVTDTSAQLSDIKDNIRRIRDALEKR